MAGRTSANVKGRSTGPLEADPKRLQNSYAYLELEAPFTGVAGNTGSSGRRVIKWS